MTFLSDLRRLLFGAKAVTRSAAEKTGDTVKETIRETKEDLDAWMERVRKESGTPPPEGPNVAPPPVSPTEPDPAQAGDDLLHKAGDLAEKAGSAILEQGKKVEEGIEEIGEKVLSVGEAVARKAGDLAGKAGEEIMEKGSVLLDRAKEVFRDTRDKVEEKAGEFYDQAQEAAARHDREEAARKAEEEARTAKYASGSPEGKSHAEALDESLMAGKDDFFEKADQFSKGNYHHGEMTIEPGEEKPARKPEGQAYGFEDRDGDGDEIIDDAEVEDDKPA